MLALTLAFATLQGSHLPLHPARAQLALEVPDVAKLLAAYEKTPLVALTRDEAARAAFARFGEQMKFDASAGLRPLLELAGLPPTTGTDELLGMAQRASRFSLSVSTREARAGELRESFERAVRTQLEILDIEDALAAAGSADKLERLDTLALEERLRTDEWGRPFQLERTSSGSLRIFSLGADGASGGNGENTDIDAELDQESWIEKALEQRRAILVAIDFTSDALAATSLTELMTAVGADTTDRTRTLQFAGANATWSSFTTTKPAEQEGWSLRTGARVLLGFGASKVEDVVARLADPESALAAEARWSAMQGALGAPSGVVIAHGVLDTDVLAGLLSEAVDLLPAPAAQSRLEPQPTAFRMQLVGERFHTDLWRPEANDGSWFGALGVARPDAATLELVPADAAGVLATRIDVARLERQFRARVGLDEVAAARLAELEQKHGFDLSKDVFGNLAGGMSLHVMPLNSIGLPNIVGMFELRDAAAFERGMQGLAAAFAEQPGQTMKLKASRYRDAALWTIETGGSSDSPIPFDVSPTIAIAGGRAIFATTALFAKREVKRVLGDEPKNAEPLAKFAGAPADATLVGAMDWRSMIDSLYTTLRGAAALAGGFADLPIDLTALSAALPEKPEVFTRFFAPTTMWGRPVEHGFHLHLEASFGPETWISLAALGTSVVTSMTDRPGDTSEAPAPPEVPASAAELATTKLALDRVATRLFVYQLDQGTYPEALAALTQPTESYPQGYLDGEPLPKDGWGRELLYRRDGDGYRVWSSGADGVDGTADDVQP
ncbi:MAG: type II secretion system protein GspG [Planctomycetota bacterium]|nr:type II secretion system protein GspG [Planctomycetota bacterium]